MDFWYLRISRKATVPGRYLCGFLTPPVAGADLRAALVANCFLGALPPVDLRAVCFVRAIVFFLFVFCIYKYIEKRVQCVCGAGVRARTCVCETQCYVVEQKDQLVDTPKTTLFSCVLHSVTC